MRVFIYCVVLSLLLSLSLTACGMVKKPKVVNPCDNAPKHCWVAEGHIGIDPSSKEDCRKLIACYSWELRAK